MAKRSAIAIVLALSAAAATAGPRIGDLVEAGAHREALWRCAGLFEASGAREANADRRAYAARLSAAMVSAAGENPAQIEAYRADYAAQIARDPDAAGLAEDIEACAWIAMSLAQ